LDQYCSGCSSIPPDKELVLSLGEKSQIQALEHSRPTPLPMVGEVEALLTTTSVAPL
jgi:hypothetical protein